MASNAFRRAAGAAAVTVAAVAGVVGASGTASAGVETQTVSMPGCFGLSPFIIDQPFQPSGLSFYQWAPGGGQLLMADAGSLWFFTAGYRSDIKIDWHNRANNARGTLTQSAQIGYSSRTAVQFDLNSGAGDVDLTMSAVNSLGPVVIPTSSCSGVVHVH